MWGGGQCSGGSSTQKEYFKKLMQDHIEIVEQGGEGRTGGWLGSADWAQGWLGLVVVVHAKSWTSSWA